MPFFRLRKKQKAKVDEKRLHDAIQQELSGYLKEEELQKYLEKIKRDERRRQIWDSMSSRRKIKLLRYVLEKKGASHGKK